MSIVDYTGITIDGRYRVIRLLDQGGMGAVYLGEHIALGRLVAVKFLLAEYAHRDDVIKRFYREARAAAAIKHPNIIDVSDVGLSSQGEPFIVMEYLEGESLAQMLARVGPIDIPAACGILEPALRALQVAHEKKIVHRDIKPDNIFLHHGQNSSPEIKLIDFGISKTDVDVGQTKLTRTGVLLGTPAYMSPEQARGEAGIDHRTDLYSMGVVLYEMLTGTLPYTASNYNTLIVSLLTEEPRPPKEAYDNFPIEAEEVLMTSLAKDPMERYQSADDMLAALRHLSGFSKRQERLTHYASSITKRSFAAGDLGNPLTGSGSSGDVAQSLFSPQMENHTPRGWTRTTGDRARSKMALIWGPMALVLVALVALYVFFRRSDEKNRFGAPTEVTTVPTSSVQHVEVAPVDAVAPDAERVQITVEGAPVGSTIYYDGAQVFVNPFTAKRGRAAVPLRVEANGFETFLFSLTPVEDTAVHAVLKKIEPPQKIKSVKRDRAPSQKRKESQKVSARKLEQPNDKMIEIVEVPEKDKFVKGGRETEIAEDFE